jgi:hypothetical protein
VEEKLGKRRKWDGMDPIIYHSIPFIFFENLNNGITFHTTPFHFISFHPITSIETKPEKNSVFPSAE